MARKRTVLMVVLAFALGVAVGATGGGLYLKSRVQGLMQATPDQRRAFLFDRLSGQLQLTADQKPAIRDILARTQDEFLAARETLRPRMRRILDSAVQDMKKELTSEQARRLDALVQKWVTPFDRYAPSSARDPDEEARPPGLTDGSYHP